MILPALIAAVMSQESQNPRARANEVKSRLGLQQRRITTLRSRMDWIRTHQRYSYPYLYINLMVLGMIPPSAFVDDEDKARSDGPMTDPLSQGPQLSPNYADPELGKIIAWIGVKLHEDIRVGIATLAACDCYVFSDARAFETLEDQIEAFAEEIDEPGAMLAMWESGVRDEMDRFDENGGVGMWQANLPQIRSGELFFNIASWQIMPDGSVLVGERDGPCLRMVYQGDLYHPGVYINPVAYATSSPSTPPQQRHIIHWKVVELRGVPGTAADEIRARIEREGGVLLSDLFEANVGMVARLPGREIWMTEPTESALRFAPIFDFERLRVPCFVTPARLSSDPDALSDAELDLVVLWLLYSAQQGFAYTSAIVEGTENLIGRIREDIRHGGAPLEGSPGIMEALEAVTHRHRIRDIELLEEDLFGPEALPAEGLPAGGVGAHWKMTPGIEVGAALPLDDDHELSMSWPDGAVIVKLSTQKHLSDEGAAMRHCVGTHAAPVERGEAAVYSYRVLGEDGRGFAPRATAEVAGYAPYPTSDIKAHHNTPVRDEQVAARMAAFLWYLRTGEIGVVPGQPVVMSDFEKTWLSLQDRQDLDQVVQQGAHGASIPPPPEYVDFDAEFDELDEFDEEDLEWLEQMLGEE